jgi:hypothetical protein
LKVTQGRPLAVAAKKEKVKHQRKIERKWTGGFDDFLDPDPLPSVLVVVEVE